MVEFRNVANSDAVWLPRGRRAGVRAYMSKKSQNKMHWPSRAFFGKEQMMEKWPKLVKNNKSIFDLKILHQF